VTGSKFIHVSSHSEDFALATVPELSMPVAFDKVILSE
jgi:hypothetical protein